MRSRNRHLFETSPETDEALRTRREEVLPVLERLGDLREICVTLYEISMLRLSMDRLDQTAILDSMQELAESLRIANELDTPDGIGAVGLAFARLLAQAGHTKQALDALQAVDAAFQRISDQNGQHAARALCRSIEAPKGRA